MNNEFYSSRRRPVVLGDRIQSFGSWSIRSASNDGVVFHRYRSTDGMGLVPTQELLKFARNRIAAAVKDADSVQVMLGRWRIIQFRLGKLSAQLQDLSTCSPSFLESYSLCGEVLEAVLVTIEDSQRLARRCSEISYREGKLQTQSVLDALAARLHHHINDCDVVIKNSLMKESLEFLTGKRSSNLVGFGSSVSESRGISTREMLRWAVRDLVTRLQIGIDPTSKHQALNSVVELMDQDDKNVLVVAGQGGIPVIVHMLDAGMPCTVREKAASAVCSLARAGCCEQELVAEGALPPLVRLLESGTGLAKERAVAALHSLTYTPENARTVAAQGGVPALVQLCRSGTPAAQASAAGSLRNLAIISELRVIVAEDGEEAEFGTVAALLGLIRSGTDAARESATDALHSLSSTYGVSRGIARLSAVEAVLRFLETFPPPKSRQFAIGILKNISSTGGVAGSAAYNALLKVSDGGGGNDDDHHGGAGKKMVNRKRLIVGNVMLAWKQIQWRNSSSRLDTKIKNFFFRR